MLTYSIILGAIMLTNYSFNWIISSDVSKNNLSMKLLST